MPALPFFSPAGFRPHTTRGGEDCGVSAPHDEGRRIAGFRPHTTRSFCFGKRTQNQWRPGGAPKRGCLCHGPCYLGCGTRCAQTVLAPKMEGTGPGHSPARRRRDNGKGQRRWILACARMTEKNARTTAFSCHPRLPPPVIPDPRLKMSRTSPDRGSRVFLLCKEQENKAGTAPTRRHHDPVGDVSSRALANKTKDTGCPIKPGMTGEANAASRRLPDDKGI